MMRIKVLFLLALLILSQGSMAQTEISGSILTSTWDMDGSPYLLLEDVTLEADNILTIEPGVVVQGEDGVRLFVSGGVEATGTEEQPILFTSIDDEVYWDGIDIENSTSPSTFSYCVFERAGVFHGRANGTAFNVHDGEVSLSYCDIRDCFTGAQAGAFYAYEATVSITYSRVYNNIAGGLGCVDLLNSDVEFHHNLIAFNQADRGAAMSFWGGTMLIDHCTFYNNTATNPEAGTAFHGGGNNTITNSIIISDPAYPVASSDNTTLEYVCLSHEGILDGENVIIADPLFIDPENLDFSLSEFSLCVDAGDPNYALDPDETVTDLGWTWPPVPDEAPEGTQISGDIETSTWSVDGSPYLIVADATVLADQILTIEPGVIVRGFEGVRIFVSGAIEAEGTEEELILFTSHLPDNYWDGIDIENATAPSIFSYCIFERAGVFHGRANGTAFNVRDCDVTLTHCDIRNCFTNAQAGAFYAYEATVSISYSRVYNNTAGGLGCVDLIDSDVDFHHNLIAFNNAGYGAAMSFWGGEMLIDHCTFYQNSASQPELGTAFYGEGNNNITNSIIISDPEYPVASSANTTLEYVCLSHEGILEGDNVIIADPLFIDPLALDFRLALESPCIDAGDPEFEMDPDDTVTDLGWIWPPTDDEGGEGTEISGEILTSTWTLMGNPYIIVADATIPEDETLTIEPGVIVQGYNQVRIMVNGSLLAEGSNEDPILFTAFDTEMLWDGIDIDNGTAPSIFNHCIFEYAGVFHGRSNGTAFNVRDCEVTLENCEIRSCSTGHQASAFYAYEATVSMSYTKVYNNTAGGLGCVDLIYSDVDFHHNLIANNTSGYGAGMSFWGGAMVIDHCTFYNNTATNPARGTTFYGGGNNTITNSIIISDPDYPVASSDNTTLEYVCLSHEGILDGVGVIIDDPVFVDPENWDFRLMEGSPCIDAGSPEFALDPDGTITDLGWEWPPYGADGGDLTIPIAANYFELVSSNRLFSSSNPQDVFGNIRDLDIVYAANGDIYLPGIPPEWDANPNQGYYIFTPSPAVWVVEGPMIPTNTEYTLTGNQWSWIGYPFDSEVPVTSALSEVQDAVAIMLSDDGRLWVPNRANTMGSLRPGEGYLIFSREDINFTFQRDILAGATDQILQIPSVSNAPPSSGKPYAILLNLDDQLKTSAAIVEAYDHGVLVGKSMILNDHPVTPLIAWEGDSELEIPGFTSGSGIELKLLTDSGDRIAFTMNEAVAEYGKGAFAELSLKTVELPDNFVVSEVYPNPFNSTFRVEYSVPEPGEVSVTIFDVLGRQVYGSNSAVERGAHQLSIKTTDKMVSGVYFLQVEYMHQIQSQKILLLK
ncbi:right-handed parallel beta-helix repeat-containing protein [bacterium]|nr:right-handed parallel beta-helix repeat-containing protein [bacterium]